MDASDPVTGRASLAAQTAGKRATVGEAVAVVPSGSRVYLGTACAAPRHNPTTNLAEIAFMVAPEWQGCGLGSALQRRLQEYADARGVRGFTAEILSQNARMLSLANRAHGSITRSSEVGEVHVTILFADGERGAAVA